MLLFRNQICKTSVKRLCNPVKNQICIAQKPKPTISLQNATYHILLRNRSGSKLHQLTHFRTSNTVPPKPFPLLHRRLLSQKTMASTTVDDKYLAPKEQPVFLLNAEKSFNGLTDKEKLYAHYLSHGLFLSSYHLNFYSLLGRQSYLLTSM